MDTLNSQSMGKSIISKLSYDNSLKDDKEKSYIEKSYIEKSYIEKSDIGISRTSSKEENKNTFSNR